MKILGQNIKGSVQTLVLSMLGVFISSVCLGCADQELVYTTKLVYSSQDAQNEIAKDEELDFKRYEKERIIYADALAAYTLGDMNTVKQIRATSLRDYPLSIYLDFSLLQLPSASITEVQKFISDAGHETLSNRLKAFYIKSLSDNKDYKNLLKISPTEPKSEGLKCLWQEARFYNGYKTQISKQILHMYRAGNAMAPGCVNLVGELKKNGVLTSKDTLMRMLNAYWTRGGNKVYKNAANILKKGSYAKAVKILDKYYDTPSKYKRIPQNMRSVAATVFRRYARMDPIAAYEELADFKKLYRPNALALADIKETMAYYMLFEKENVPMKFVDSVLANTKNIRYLEQRFRRAVWDQDYGTILNVIERMPSTNQKADNIRYWKGRALIATGQKGAGKEILTALAQERSFYAFYTAQELGLPILVNESAITVNSTKSELIQRNAPYARYVEFSYLGDKIGMRTEWAETMRNATLNDARMIAVIESPKDETLGIWETIYKKDWGALQLRFPQSYRDIYKRESELSGVSETFMYGITRQESMMNHKAISPVGARGLMQIMPSTAKMVSKKHSLNYTTADELIEPEVNVRLGGKYLRDLLDTFSDNRVFVSAGYNAGPGRALRWQSKDGNKRDLITYVESIPFNETRGYVQHVIFYDYMYQYLQGVTSPVFLTQAEIEYAY